MCVQADLALQSLAQRYRRFPFIFDLEWPIREVTGPGPVPLAHAGESVLHLAPTIRIVVRAPLGTWLGEGREVCCERHFGVSMCECARECARVLCECVCDRMYEREVRLGVGE